MAATLLQIAGLLAVLLGGFLLSPGAAVIAAGVVAVYVGLSMEDR